MSDHTWSTRRLDKESKSLTKDITPTTMQLSIKLNTFLKCTRINTSSTCQLTDSKKDEWLAEGIPVDIRAVIHHAEPAPPPNSKREKKIFEAHH